MTFTGGFNRGEMMNIEPGVYEARLSSVTDAIITFEGKDSQALQFEFILVNGTDELKINKRVNKSLSTKSNLYKLLKGMSPAFTPEVAADDAKTVALIASLQGQPFLIQVSKKANGWTNIDSVMRAPHTKQPSLLKQTETKDDDVPF